MIRLYCFLLLMLLPPAMVAQNATKQEAKPHPSTDLKSLDFEKLIDSSNVHYSNGKYHQSLKVSIALLQKALAENDFYYIHRGYRHLAYDYLAITDTLSAEENFYKSEKFAQQSENDTARALSYMDMANLYSSIKKNHSKAMDYHDRSIELFEKIKDTLSLTKAHYNSSLTALEAENYNRVFLDLIKAKKLAEHIDDESLKIGIEGMFGQYYLKKENYEMAEIYLNRVIQEAGAHKLTVELESAYYDLSEVYSAQGKYKEAFEARKLYEENYESNLSNMTSAEVEAMSAKFQVDEFRNDVLDAELKNQLQAKIVESKSRLNIILIIVCGCVLLVLTLILFAYRKRKQLIKKLRDKNLEYLKAKRQSEQLSKAKSNFFSTVSHELRTPLYGVIGLSSILLEDESLKSHEKDLKSLKFSADYLLALINDVLQINKLDSDKLEEHTETFHLTELMDSIVASFEYMRLQNANHIEVAISEDIPTYLDGNSVKLSQVLMNLVGNACKFTEDGRIILKADKVVSEGDRINIRFSVIDNGIGIAKEKLSSIFDEFEQGESLNYNYQGTGLGLPIVKRLLQHSNSEIKVESTLGKGSTFSFELEFEASSKHSVEQEAPLYDSTQLKNKKVLVAEDNRINQIVTKKILEKNGMICTIAENGKIASDLVENNTYDLILMDLNMPVMDGIQAAREIRSFNDRIPIVALTAVEVEEVRNEIFESGMSDIIVKPYDANKFIQTIVANINEQGRPATFRKEKKVI